MLGAAHAEGGPWQRPAGWETDDRKCSSARAGLEVLGLPPGKDAKDASDV